MSVGEKRLKKICLSCGGVFVIPRSRDWREHCCSSECKAAHREKQKQELVASRTRHCQKCGNPFVVKKSQMVDGQGKYCSMACAPPINSYAHTEEAQKNRTIAVRKAVAEGRLVHRSGEAHPQWTGGIVEAKRRRREKMIALTASGEAAKRLREYRRNNVEKTREYVASRSRRKYGRLPKGTVANIKLLQRCKCAVCKKDISSSFHVDHIMPLARGGKHEANNIQLLCPTCNLTKSAKHPIDFMQSKGFLL